MLQRDLTGCGIQLRGSFQLEDEGVQELPPATQLEHSNILHNTKIM